MTLSGERDIEDQGGPKSEILQHTSDVEENKEDEPVVMFSEVVSAKGEQQCWTFQMDDYCVVEDGV